MSDDDDEPAISGEQEAEVTPESPAAPADDDGDYDPEAEAEARVGASEVARGKVGAGRHPVSKEVRDLLKKAADDVKRQMGSGETEEDQVQYDEGERPAPGDKRTKSVGDTAQAQQVMAPPAPSLDPEVTKLREQLMARGAELDNREKALSEREAKSSASFAERYGDGKPVEALRDLLKQHGLISTDEEWKDEVADLISDLSGQVLEVHLPSELRNKIDAKRALRAVQIDRRRRADREAAIERKRLEAQQQSERSQFHMALTKELEKPEHVNAYPWLRAEDDPAGVILEVAQAQFQKDGSTITWQQAAQRANDYLSSYGADYNEKRRHLLDRLPRRGTNGQPPRPSGKTTQQASQVRTSEPPEPPPAPKQTDHNGNPRNWAEKHRESTKRMFRKAFTPD